MSQPDDNPFPFPGAAALLTQGPAAAHREAERRSVVQPQTEVMGMLVEAAVVAADAATVLLFGSPAQQQEVSTWMNRNRQRS